MNKTLLFFTLIFTFSCTYDNLEVDPTMGACTAALPSKVSFSHDIIPILEKNCSIAGCHSGKTPEGNLNLETAKAYASLWKTSSGYIDTINPKSSVLNLTLISKTSPMPPMGRLDDCTLELIRKWMGEGAKNN